MSIFNKKLTIDLPEDSLYTHENESPSVNESSTVDKDNLLQLREFRDGADSEFGDTRHEGRSSKLNFVEFEEFNAHLDEVKEKTETKEMKSTLVNKRNVYIEVPDRDENDDHRFRNLQSYNSLYDEDKFKEPPAPSKGSKNSKVFIFPSTPTKRQEKGPSKDTNHLDDLKQSFERERQEFYREKSKLEKEILIKNGQIEMLHKLLTETIPNQRQNVKSNVQEHCELGFTHHEQFENIIIHKDLQISELLEKISELNNLLTKKSEETAKKVVEVSTLQSLAESLKNQLYIYEHKDQNDKLTKKFYELQKEKQLSKDEEQFMLSTEHRGEFGFKGLENLHKRIEMVRMNRIGIEFESRNKIKSDMSYSQTTKNRTKGAFDFKGKTFDTANLNKTRMY